MSCTSYVDFDLQNDYWEGFTQATEATSLFVWKFYGKLIHCRINYPGS